MDEWQLPRTGPVPPLVFIAPAGSREVLEADVAEPNELPRKIHTNCNGGLVLILPGGGYRKVEVEKEGRAIGRHFASQGFVCCVVDYQLGPFASFSMRASTAEPSLADAVAALEFVQTEPRSGAGTLFEASRVALCGFSAGGHLSLCLLREIARAESQVKSGCEPEPEPEPSPTPHPRPPVAALMLVYPTIRNPCCWCIAGGLWILPGYIGASWPAEAEHAYCLQSDTALQELLPVIPRRICSITTRGDMLLPTHKHAGVLIDAVREYGVFHGGIDLMTIEGPITANHGCGLRDWWGDQSRQWLLDVLIEPDTEVESPSGDASGGSEPPVRTATDADARETRQP